MIKVKLKKDGYWVVWKEIKDGPTYHFGPFESKIDTQEFIEKLKSKKKGSLAFRKAPLRLE